LLYLKLALCIEGVFYFGSLYQGCVNCYHRVCNNKVTQRVLHVKQELHTLPSHLNSHPIYIEIRVSRSLVFFVVLCRSWFVLVLLVIILYILWYTSSDYPFDIFKFFFWLLLYQIKDIPETFQPNTIRYIGLYYYLLVV
jgi:hypothetical protein